MKARRWLARLAILFMIASVVILAAFSGRQGIWLILTGIAGACLEVAGGYWFLANRGFLRWSSLTLALAVPVGLIALYASRQMLRVSLVSMAALLLAIIVARSAMGTATPGGAPRSQRPGLSAHS